MKHTLKNGIVVEDNRDVQYGVNIKNQKFTYFKIIYSSNNRLEVCYDLIYDRIVSDVLLKEIVSESKEVLKAYRQIKKLLKI